MEAFWDVSFKSVDQKKSAGSFDSPPRYANLQYKHSTISKAFSLATMKRRSLGHYMTRPQGRDLSSLFSSPGSVNPVVCMTTLH